jgi:hypothetical protein
MWLFEGPFLATLALVSIGFFFPKKTALADSSLAIVFALVHLPGLKLAQQLAIVGL